MENFAAELVSTFFALILVLAIAWLVLRFIKRTQFHKSSDESLRFLRALPVGSRERVVLVQYRGKEYMLGVTSGGINLIEKRALENEELTDEKSNSTGS